LLSCCYTNNYISKRKKIVCVICCRLMSVSRFQVHNIDPIYTNSAIREMNEKTAKGFNDLYGHIEEWSTYGGAILDMLRVRGIEQDVIDNIISHTPQLILPTLPQIIPVDEGCATKKRKATIRKSDQQLIEDMLNSVAYDAVDTPTIHEPVSQMSYDLPALQQVLEAGVLSLSCVERYQLNNIYNFGQWLLLARQPFNTAKESGNLIFWSNNFVDWLEERCRIKKSKAYDYMHFTQRFAAYPKVLKCRLSFDWFRINEKRIAAYLQANDQAAAAWL